MSDVTHILNAIDAGDPHAINQLLPLVYDELRQLAAAQMAHEKPGQTLDATALVHEAYLRLVRSTPGDSPGANWENRRHFFAAAAEAMRRILVERARQRKSLKRGAGHQRDGLDPDQIAVPERDSQLLSLNDALNRFQEKDPQKAELVKLRYFAGLTADKAAAALGVSPSSADRMWFYARAWLRRELGRDV